MPEKLTELTEQQKKLLDLLFLEENYEARQGGSWTTLCEMAGYATGTSKAVALRSSRFREELEKRLGEYQVGMQFEAIMITDDVLTGRHKDPFSGIRLSAAKDTLDRSKKFIKKTEQKIETDMPAAVIFLPEKEDIDE